MRFKLRSQSKLNEFLPLKTVFTDGVTSSGLYQKFMAHPFLANNSFKLLQKYH